MVAGLAVGGGGEAVAARMASTPPRSRVQHVAWTAVRMPSWTRIRSAPLSKHSVALLAGPFGLDVAAIDAILLNGVRKGFLPDARRDALAAAFAAELAALKAAHLPA